MVVAEPDVLEEAADEKIVGVDEEILDEY